MKSIIHVNICPPLFKELLVSLGGVYSSFPYNHIVQKGQFVKKMKRLVTVHRLKAKKNIVKKTPLKISKIKHLQIHLGM